MQDEHEGDATVIRDLAVGATVNRWLSDRKAIAVVPRGYEMADLEPLLPQPARKRGIVQVQDVESLIRMVNRHKTADTLIYGDPQRGIVTAVLNDHGDDAQWADHRIRYTAPWSEEWKRWTGIDGESMDQATFARWLEENSIDIVDPAPATILSVARGLEIHEDSQFKSAVRLDSGDVQFKYEQDSSAKVRGAENLTVPTEFTICLPVHFNGVFYRVRVFLRHRKSGDGAKFFIELHRRREAELDSFQMILDEIEHGGERHISTKDHGDGDRADGGDDGAPAPRAFEGTGLRPLMGTPPEL